MTGRALKLAPPAAQVMSLALHELATNAAKHGAFSVPQGRVCIEWGWRDDGRIGLRWTERNGPAVKPPSSAGLGIGIIERSIGHQLGGSVHLDWRPEGLACELVVPGSLLTLDQAAA